MDESCPICHTKGRIIRSHLTNDGHPVRIFYCRSCQYYWLDPKKLKIANIGNYLDLLESVKTVRNINNQRILDVLDQLFVKKQNVQGLEVGSATGSFLRASEMYERFHFTGIEPMVESYNICIQQGLNCINGMFPDDLPKEIGEFDLIVFNDVFEHIPDSSSLIEKCVKLLNNDGVIVINCPVNSGVLFHIGKALDKIHVSGAFNRLWQLNTSSPHLHYFSQKALVRLMEMSGFKLVRKPLKMLDLDKNTIANRVRAVPMDKIQAEIFITGLNVFFPYLKFFPNDTKCYIFKKTSSVKES